ncbi:MAG TPA: Rrf2 family transcriptional regulator [Candidatus Binatia bacterium]
MGSKRPPERSSLMNVGRRVDYAVRALSYLAGQPAGKIVSRLEIEKKQEIPASYLSKIMKDLVAGGLVNSHIGSKGGFSLVRAPETVSLKEVYEAVERPLVLMDCLEQGEQYCTYCGVCTQRSVWENVQNLVADYLAKVSIHDIADPQGLKHRLAPRPQGVVSNARH